MPYAAYTSWEMVEGKACGEKSITALLVYTYWHVDELQQLNALVMTPHKLQKVSSYIWKLFIWVFQD